MFECNFSKGVWQNSIPKMIQQEESGIETKQRWNQIFMFLRNAGMVEQGMYILWLLWKNRNNCFHNQICSVPAGLTL